MPKTNHSREFVDQKEYACPPGDFCKGKHGAAKKSRGIKKFFNSRTRFHAKQQLVKAIKDPDTDIAMTRFEISHRSKIFRRLWAIGNPRWYAVGHSKPKPLDITGEK